jgi:hypothetical protein
VPREILRQRSRLRLEKENIRTTVTSFIHTLNPRHMQSPFFNCKKIYMYTILSRRIRCSFI